MVLSRTVGLQLETRPISHDQLAVEVKGIYAGLVMVMIILSVAHKKLTPKTLAGLSPAP